MAFAAVAMGSPIERALPRGRDCCIALTLALVHTSKPPGWQHFRAVISMLPSDRTESYALGQRGSRSVGLPRGRLCGAAQPSQPRARFDKQVRTNAPLPVPSACNRLHPVGDRREPAMLASLGLTQSRVRWQKEGSRPR
jgi:hypothetical protein